MVGCCCGVEGEEVDCGYEEEYWDSEDENYRSNGTEFVDAGGEGAEPCFECCHLAGGIDVGDEGLRCCGEGAARVEQAGSRGSEETEHVVVVTCA